MARAYVAYSYWHLRLYVPVRNLAELFKYLFTEYITM